MTKLMDIAIINRSVENTATVHMRDRYRDILSEKDRGTLEKVFARELAYFNYKW